MGASSHARHADVENWLVFQKSLALFSNKSDLLVGFRLSQDFSNTLGEKAGTKKFVSEMLHGFWNTVSYWNN